MKEIIESVFQEVRNYGYQETRKRLIAGIVLTGGGAQLKHIAQLFEYITGMSTRIGYPSEHLASGSDPELSSPQYATSIGLVMQGVKDPNIVRSMAIGEEELVEEEQAAEATTVEDTPGPEEPLAEEIVEEQTEEVEDETKGPKPGNWLDRWSKKFLSFLENDVD
jgi:cell division protein FtsA